MRFGLDSTSMVPIAGHRQVGSTFACRYLSPEPWKNCTAAEVSEYRHGGIDLVLVFEDGAQNALRGHDAGQRDAAFALAQATGLGVHEHCAIYMAVDFDTSPDPSAIDAYFDGCRVVLGDRCGIYGGMTSVSRQMDRGVKYGWQTYAWSGGRWDPRAQVQQYSNDHTVAGVGVDYNHATAKDFGQVGFKPAPPPDPHHYGRFDHTPRAILDGKSEVEVVKRYDELRGTQTFHKHPHRQELSRLRTLCSTAAERIDVVAAAGAMPGWGDSEPGMNVFWRQWRHDELVKRSHGRTVKS
jgi:hypothetical protein